MGSTTGCLSAGTASRGLGVFIEWGGSVKPTQDGERHRLAGKWAVRAVRGYGWRWRPRFGGVRSDVGWGASAQEFAGRAEDGRADAGDSATSATSAGRQLSQSVQSGGGAAPRFGDGRGGGVADGVRRVGSSGASGVGRGRWRRAAIGLCGMAATRRARRWPLGCMSIGPK